jgi:dihydroorotase
MSAQPAEVVSLEGRGTLKVGSFADVVVFDPAAEWSFDAKKSRSKSRNTPFDGAGMVGRVMATICEGRVVYRG